MNITKAQFLSYENVRQSGVTNMFAVNVVCDLTNLTKEQVFEIMANYSTLAEQYGEEKIRRMV